MKKLKGILMGSIVGATMLSSIAAYASCCNYIQQSKTLQNSTSI